MIIADIITKAIQKHCPQYPDLKKEAEVVVKRFTTLMQLFRRCHKGYNSSTYMSDRKINKLGK